MERQWNGIWIRARKGYSCMYENMPHSPYFRSVFKASGKEKNAVVFLCGLGVHELRINGQRVGDRWYAPALSQYDRRAGYIEYDLLLRFCVRQT